MEYRNTDCGCRCLVGACRFFGIVTALFLWGVGVEYLYNGTIFGTYFLIIAVITSFLEAVFLLNHVVEVCVSRTSVILRIWDGVQWIDDWKKGGLYFVGFAPACFVHPAEIELGVPAGCLLIVTGVLYMLKTFKTKRDEEDTSIEENATYDRFDDGHEDIEEDVINPTHNPGGGMTSLADQNEILDL
ncbi:transmembrane protein 72 [Aplysia californica]|uniref:Transmembrane protein 72 n=1 Tax=Aplysia californica TaxID=6500 RepID=A0ABM0ZUF9_APLCA|nr:transmembrane protein 72 [Aplysia californica]